MVGDKFQRSSWVKKKSGIILVLSAKKIKIWTVYPTERALQFLDSSLLPSSPLNKREGEGEEEKRKMIFPRRGLKYYIFPLWK